MVKMNISALKRLDNGLDRIANYQLIREIGLDNVTVVGGFLRDLVANVRHNDVDIKIRRKSFPAVLEHYKEMAYSDQIKIVCGLETFDIGLFHNVPTDVDVNSLYVHLGEYMQWKQKESHNIAQIPVRSCIVGRDHIVNLILRFKFNISPDLRDSERLYKILSKGYSLNLTQHNLKCLYNISLLNVQDRVSPGTHLHNVRYTINTLASIYVGQCAPWSCEKDREEYLKMIRIPSS